MSDYEECHLPGGASGCGEWCRYYCSNYGTGVCHYDSKTGKMLIRIPEEAVQ